MKNIKCIILDFGNVIAFFDHHLFCKHLAVLSGNTIAEQDIYQFIFEDVLDANLEKTIERRFDRGQMERDEFCIRLRRRFTAIHDCTDNDIAAAWSDIFTPNPDVIALLPELSKNYRLILGSNINVLHYEYVSRVFSDELKHFDAQVLSYKVKCRKPDSAFFRNCVEAAQCGPTECLFIDDLSQNVEAAQDFGIHSIQYDPNQRSAQTIINQLG